MQAFGPQHPDHQRVLWPPEMQLTSVELPPSILALLSHNTLPSPGDRSAAKTYQASVTQEIVENEKERELAEEEILRLQAKIRRLQQTRKSLVKQKFACEVVFSPFRRLPDDVLYNIAHKFCSDSGPNYYGSPPPVILLGHVSRTFRYIVRSTSSLWTKMRAVWSQATWNEYTTRQMVTQIRHFTDLSASLPLSIRLEERDSRIHDLLPTTPAYDGPFPVLEWMLDTSSPDGWGGLSRVKQLDISSYQSISLLKMITSALTAKQRTLTLDSLLLAQGHRGIDFTSINRMEIQETLDLLPSLTKLWVGTSLLHIPIMPLQDDIQLWTRLTVARFGDFLSTKEFRGLLALCPNLEAGWFSVSNDGNDDSPLDLPKYSHRNLKALVLQYRCRMSQPVDHLSLFTGLQFPQLVDLKLHFLTAYLKSPGRFGIVAPQLTGVFPAVQSLALLNASEIESKFKYTLPLLMGIPTITSLSITLAPEDIPEFDAFMERRGQDGGVSLPNLRALKLKFTTSDRGWMKKNEAAHTVSLKSIVRSTKSVWAASMEKMQENPSPAPSISQDSEFTLSISFNWSTDYNKIGRHGTEFEKAHKYFRALKRNFGQGDPGVLVHLGEEALPETDPDYLKAEFLKWF